MPLNAATVSSGSKSKFKPLDPGTYPARLVQVIDLGMQERGEWQGEKKAPMPHVLFTYELADEFLKDEDGQDMPDKPRWLSEVLPLFNLKADRAVSTQRYKVLDPTGAANGDFARLVSTPVSLTVVVNPPKPGKNPFEKIAGIAMMRAKDVEKLPALVNASKTFDLDQPDLAVYMSLPEWVQKRILGGLTFPGSVLEGMLKDSQGTGAKKQEDPKPLAKELDDANPF